MASMLGRSAFRATRALRQSGVNSGGSTAANVSEKRQQGQQVLQRGAKRDPELYVRHYDLFRALKGGCTG